VLRRASMQDKAGRGGSAAAPRGCNAHTQARPFAASLRPLCAGSTDGREICAGGAPGGNNEACTLRCALLLLTRSSYACGAEDGGARCTREAARQRPAAVACCLSHAAHLPRLLSSAATVAGFTPTTQCMPGASPPLVTSAAAGVAARVANCRWWLLRLACCAAGVDACSGSGDTQSCALEGVPFPQPKLFSGICAYGGCSVRERFALAGGGA
jgi:hypothetical protein